MLNATLGSFFQFPYYSYASDNVSDTAGSRSHSEHLRLCWITDFFIFLVLISSFSLLLCGLSLTVSLGVFSHNWFPLDFIALISDVLFKHIASKILHLFLLLRSNVFELGYIRAFQLPLYSFTYTHIAMHLHLPM